MDSSCAKDVTCSAAPQGSGGPAPFPTSSELSRADSTVTEQTRPSPWYSGGWLCRNRGGCRCSLKLMLVISLLLFTVVPAAIMWGVSWATGVDAVDDMQTLGQTSIEGVAMHLRDSLVTAVLEDFTNLIRPTEATMNFTVYQCLMNPFFHRNISIDDTSLEDLVHAAPNMFALLKANPKLSMVSLAYSYRPEPWIPDAYIRYIQQWSTFSRGSYDPVLDQPVSEYLSGATQSLNAFRNATLIRIVTVDQASGSINGVLAAYPPRSPVLTANFTYNDTVTIWWAPDVYPNAYTGLSNVLLSASLPFPDLHTVVTISVYTTVRSISLFLRSMVRNPPDRLFLSFRNKLGHLLGTSHGKYFSHSDIDYSRNNSLKSPPPVKDFQMYSAVNCSDATISSAGQYLLDTYGGWDAIPEFQSTVEVGGRLYWFTGTAASTEFGMPFQLFILIDQYSFLGPIEEHREQAAHNIRQTNTRLSALLAIVIAAALALAIGVSVMVSRALARLASGMDGLAFLSSSLDVVGSGTNEGPLGGTASQENVSSNPLGRSRGRQYLAFSEVSSCQNSFEHMERKLKLLAKFVPKEVMKAATMTSTASASSSVFGGASDPILSVLMSGLNPRRATVILIETDAFHRNLSMAPVELSKCVAQFIQRVCDVVTTYNGFLMKVDGNSISAIFNSPIQPVAEHEVQAVMTAIEIQKMLPSLQSRWSNNVDLRIKISLHSDEFVMGFVNSAHRLPFSCLGPGMVVLQKLQILNEVFRTSVLCSERVLATPGAAAVLQFRKLASVALSPDLPAMGVFQPLSNDASGSEASLSLRETYEKAYSEFVGEGMDMAERTLASLLESFPEDEPSLLLTKLVRAMKKRTETGEVEPNSEFSVRADVIFRNGTLYML